MTVAPVTVAPVTVASGPGRTPVLIVIGGLPATGKSTVARLLAERTHIPYLRVDRIEQAVVAWSSLTHPVGAVGYAVAHSLAAEQLSLGLDVVVECVNPVALTRDAWLATADTVAAQVIEVELVCSDTGEHRRRVETRSSDVEGLIKPSWSEVVGREYEPWVRPHLVLDTATQAAEVLVEVLIEAIERTRGRSAAAASGPDESPISSPRAVGRDDRGWSDD